MNVKELLNQLEECNEESTVACVMQSADASIYHTIVIRTEVEEELVDIIVMDINDKGLTVKQLKDELSEYEATLPVCIKENRLKPVRFPYQINGVKNEGDIVYLELPTLMAGLYKE